MTNAAQQLTCSAVLLLSPFLTSTLSPAINHPFTELSGGPLALPGIAYNFAGPVDLAKKHFNVIEQFAAQLVANTKDLDPRVATALNDDFWLLYES